MRTHIEYLLQSLFHFHKFRCTKRHQTRICKGSILAYVTSAKNALFPENPPEIQSAAVQPVKPNVLQQADSLFAQKRYEEAYELLQQVRSTSNPLVLWRISRVLFQILSTNKTLPDSVKQGMIDEAYFCIKEAQINGDSIGEVHKWTAILLDAKAGQEGIFEKTKAIPRVREHLQRALVLDPNDVTVLYLLGYLSYQLANLNWFQEKLATFMFGPPPKATFREAYEYFLQVEEQNPRHFASNMFMLAKSCYSMGNYYQAKYYFDISAGLPCRNQAEKNYRESAKKFSEELKKYDVGKNALLHFLTQQWHTR